MLELAIIITIMAAYVKAAKATTAFLGYVRNDILYVIKVPLTVFYTDINFYGYWDVEISSKDKTKKVLRSRRKMGIKERAKMRSNMIDSGKYELILECAVSELDKYDNGMDENNTIGNKLERLIAHEKGYYKYDDDYKSHTEHADLRDENGNDIEVKFMDKGAQLCDNWESYM